MPTQKFTQQDIDQLSLWFQRRSESQFAWSHAVSMCQYLPGLRALYTMAAMGTAGELREVSGNGTTYDLTNNNVVDFRYTSLLPWCDFDGTNQYFNLADNANFDILGNEGYVAAAVQGLTIYTLARFDGAAAADEYVVAKWLIAGNQKSYRIARLAAGNAVATITTDGSTNFSATSTNVLAATTWYHLVLQYDPSTKLSIWVNGIEDGTNVVAVPATIFNSTADFTIGARGAPGSYIDGRIGITAVCAQHHSDAMIVANYQQMRALW